MSKREGGGGELVRRLDEIDRDSAEWPRDEKGRPLSRAAAIRQERAKVFPDGPPPRGYPSNEDMARTTVGAWLPVGSLVKAKELVPGGRAWLTPVGLRLAEDLSWEELAIVERALAVFEAGVDDAKNALKWALGDYFARVEDRAGRAAASVFTGLKRAEIRKCVWVARAVPFENRLPGIYWGYFEAIAPDPPDVQLQHLRMLANSPGSNLDNFRERVKEKRAGGNRGIEEPVKTEWDYQCPHCGFGWDGEKKPKRWIEWGEKVRLGGYRTYGLVAVHKAKRLLNPVPATVHLDQPEAEDRIDADTVEHDATAPAARRGKRPPRSS